MEKLPEVNPPSGRVPGQGLLAAPIMKRRWQRNREAIGKKCSFLRVSEAREIYRRRGAARGPPGSAGASLAQPRVGPPGPSFGAPGASVALIFYWNFPGFIGHFNYWK